jgi:hypothetical protein
METRITGLLVATSTAVLTVAGCSSPEGVERVHQQNEVMYHEDLATAREWDHHVMGIPSSGWVGIFVLAIVATVVLLVLGGIALYHIAEDKRQNAHRLNAEKERTKQIALQRGACTCCGFNPAETELLSDVKDRLR